jgi:hypothetical protein
MIRTKEFTFPKFEYMKILIKNSLKRSLWAFAFLILIACYQATKGPSLMLLLLIGLVFVFLSYIVVRCWMHSNSKNHRLFFKERVFEINSQTIDIVFKEGTTSTIQIGKIARVVKNSKCYLLFLTKKQFIYVPLSAFKTPGDINGFDSILKARKRIR